MAYGVWRPLGVLTVGIVSTLVSCGSNFVASTGCADGCAGQAGKAGGAAGGSSGSLPFGDDGVAGDDTAAASGASSDGGDENGPGGGAGGVAGSATSVGGSTSGGSGSGGRNAAGSAGRNALGGMGGNASGGSASGGSASGGSAMGGNAAGGTIGRAGAGGNAAGGTIGRAGAGNEPFPSCHGLPSNCGPTANDSCCDSKVVPGGLFNRLGQTVYPATVSDFSLDVYEITVGRFRRFVDAYPNSKPASGAGKNPHDTLDSGWNPAWNVLLPGDQVKLASGLKCNSDLATWTDLPGANENRPINCVSWYEAFAFCVFDGGRLPSEAEWNYAATGGSMQRLYPWSVPAYSSQADASYASYKLVDSCLGDGQPACTLADLVLVGTKSNGNGRWGHADLGGNVFELTRDVWADTLPVPCLDCSNQGVGTARVQRGGSYSWDIGYIDTSTRRIIEAAETWPDIGARCARTP